MPPLNLTPFSQLRVSRHKIPAHGLTPNTSLHSHPLTIYHSAYPASTSASQIESHLRGVGVVTPSWRYTMYPFSHFHSNTHEVLCVYSGRARLCFGGEDNPDRVEVEAGKGDVILLPAGVTHRLLEELEAEPYSMVGGYPPGSSPDMCYGKEEEKSKIQGIKDVKWFDRDPIYGHPI